MIPIRDHNPSEAAPVVTCALIAANVIVFLAYWNLFSNDAALHRFYADWALVPAALSEGRGYPGLFTSMFLHGGVLHLAGNMLFLWIFGDNLEEDLGHLGFLLFYLAGGVLAGLAHVAAAPGSPVPTIGASGAVAAAMGGYLLMYPRARVDVLVFFGIFFRIVPAPAWLMLGFWFALQLLSGTGSDPDGGGVAYWAHAGGFVAGLVLALPAWLKRGGRGLWTRTRGRPDHPEASYRIGRSRIPAVRRRRGDG